MSLHRLLFDTANPAESANVGAYLRTSDGTLVDKVVVSAVNRLAVDSTMKDGGGTALTSTLVSGKQSLDVNVTALTAADIDIRDLVAASDAVSAWLKDGAGTSITSTLVSGKQAVDVNVVNTASEIDWANIAVSSAAESVTTTEAALVTSTLANRRFMWVYNHGSKAVYVGTTAVSAANGFPLFPGSVLEMRLGPSVAIHAVSQSGTQDIRILQAS